jgi:hypothetical protein
MRAPLHLLKDGLWIRESSFNMTPLGMRGLHRLSIALAIVLVLPEANVQAHDPMSAESVQAYLLQVEAQHKIIASEDAPEIRARASLQLGQTLDEIREKLNGDLAAHGKVQGLASHVLLTELAARGAPLGYLTQANRFITDLRYYRDALRWSPTGPVAAQASLGLFRGQFDQGLGDDLLLPAEGIWHLAEQIRLGETLLRDYPAREHREEITFVLAIHYLRSARMSVQAQARERDLRKARELIDEFGKIYPDSLRVATLLLLLDRATRHR